MGKASRDKGARFERMCVHAFQDQGFAAERVPLSGAAGGSFRGDITSPLLHVDRVWEGKSRADGFKQLYGWLGDENYGLLLKADRMPILAVVRLDDFLALAKTAEGRK